MSLVTIIILIKLILSLSFGWNGDLYGGTRRPPTGFPSRIFGLTKTTVWILIPGQLMNCPEQKMSPSISGQSESFTMTLFHQKQLLFSSVLGLYLFSFSYHLSLKDEVNLFKACLTLCRFTIISSTLANDPVPFKFPYLERETLFYIQPHLVWKGHNKTGKMRRKRSDKIVLTQEEDGKCSNCHRKCKNWRRKW